MSGFGMEYDGFSDMCLLLTSTIGDISSLIGKQIGEMVKMNKPNLIKKT
jgi:hypothetical protein